jgi:Mce-associated membrane protein
VTAALFVGACAFSAAALHTSLTDRADDRHPARSRQANTLAAILRAVPQLPGSRNCTHQQANITEVVGVAVESLHGADADPLVFTDTTATTPLTTDTPSLKYVAYRLSLTRQDRRWLVTTMATISFVDLTPEI